MSNTISRNGTQGRVYGGDPLLVHVTDGQRANMGRQLAGMTDALIRGQAVIDGQRSPTEASEQLLCPGCYMVVSFNALVTLAKENNQPLTELARSMIAVYQRLLDCAERSGTEDFCIEEILVMLDPE